MIINNNLKENDYKYFAWKHPIKEITPTTQFDLEHYWYEVVIVKDKEVLDVIKEDNQLIDPSLFKENDSIQVDIWFVKRAELIGIKWGTSSPIYIQDSILDEFVPIRSYGDCEIKIEDSGKFISKLLGEVDFRRKKLPLYFRNIIMSHFKECISPYLYDNKISVVDVSQHVETLNKQFNKKMSSILKSYGVTCKNFDIFEISYERDGKIVVNEAPEEENIMVSDQQINNSECPKCKSQIQGFANFCPICGYKLIK